MQNRRILDRIIHRRVLLDRINCWQLWERFHMEKMEPGWYCRHSRDETVHGAYLLIQIGIRGTVVGHVGADLSTNPTEIDNWNSK